MIKSVINPMTGREITYPRVVALGLSPEHVELIKKSCMLKQNELRLTENYIDVIAEYANLYVVNTACLSQDELQTLLDLWVEVGGGQDIVLLGAVDLPSGLARRAKVFSPDDFLQSAKYCLLDVEKSKQKQEAHSRQYILFLKTLIMIRNRPGISTKQISGELEVSARTVQRYINSLRVAGEYIEFDRQKMGWVLGAEGKSLLLGEI